MAASSLFPIPQKLMTTVTLKCPTAKTSHSGRSELQGGCRWIVQMLHLQVMLMNLFSECRNELVALRTSTWWKPT